MSDDASVEREARAAFRVEGPPAVREFWLESMAGLEDWNSNREISLPKGREHLAKD